MLGGWVKPLKIIIPYLKFNYNIVKNDIKNKSKSKEALGGGMYKVEEEALRLFPVQLQSRFFPQP